MHVRHAAQPPEGSSIACPSLDSWGPLNEPRPPLRPPTQTPPPPAHPRDQRCAVPCCPRSPWQVANASRLNGVAGLYTGDRFKKGPAFYPDTTNTRHLPRLEEMTAQQAAGELAWAAFPGELRRRGGRAGVVGAPRVVRVGGRASWVRVEQQGLDHMAQPG